VEHEEDVIEGKINELIEDIASIMIEGQDEILELEGYSDDEKKLTIVNLNCEMGIRHLTSAIGLIKNENKKEVLLTIMEGVLSNEYNLKKELREHYEDFNS